MMRRSHVLVWVLALMATLMGVPIHAEEAEASLRIDAVTPEVITTSTPVTIRLSSSTPVQVGTEVEVFVEQSPLIGQEAVNQYLYEDSFPGGRVFSTRLEAGDIAGDPLGTAVTLTIPAEALPLPAADEMGLRGIAVEVETEVPMEARSLMYYQPDTAPTSRVGVIAVSPESPKPWMDMPGVTVASADDLGASAIRLPAANADVSMLAALGLEELLRTALATLPNASADVVLASDSGFTGPALSQLSDSVVVAPRSWQPEPGLVTPTARTQVGDSVVIGQWETAAELLETPVGPASDELVIRQQLRAAALWVAVEDPLDQRTLSAVVTQTNAPEVRERVSALLDSHTVSPVSFSEILDSPPSLIVRPLLNESSPDSPVLTPVLDPLAKAYSHALGVAEATPKGSSLLSSLTNAVLAPTGLGLPLKTRAAYAARAVATLDEKSSPVDVVPLGAVNVVNNNANFPVSVRNSGSEAISVQVSLVSSDPILQSRKSAYAQVEPKSTVEVQIPVTAVGYGDVDVSVLATTPAGVILDDSQTVEVRVRATWEDRGTIAVLSLITALFIAGLVRTLIRRKRAGREPEGD